MADLDEDWPYPEHQQSAAEKRRSILSRKTMDQLALDRAKQRLREGETLMWDGSIWPGDFGDGNRPGLAVAKEAEGG